MFFILARVVFYNEDANKMICMLFHLCLDILPESRRAQFMCFITFLRIVTFLVTVYYLLITTIKWKKWGGNYTCYVSGTSLCSSFPIGECAM